MRKKIIYMLIIFMFMVLVSNVNALPSTFNMSNDARINLTLDNETRQVIQTPGGYTNHYPKFDFKKSESSGDVICLSGLTVEAPGLGVQCRTTNWSDIKQSYGAGYILNLMYSSSASTNEKYYFSEILIEYYLGTLNFSNEAPHEFESRIVNDSSFKVPGTNKSFMEIVNGATSYANSVVAQAASIKVDGSNQANLTFTLNEDGYYYSNQITIESNKSYGNVTPNNSKFTVIKDGNKYKFKIKETDIAQGSSESLDITISVNNSYYSANRYECGDGVQNVTLSNYDTNSTSSSINIKGTVQKDYSEVTISKKDVTGTNELPGATLQILDSNKQEMSCQIKVNGEYTTLSNCSWVSGTTQQVIYGLADGTYYLKETQAPTDYVVNTEMVKFTVTNGSGNAVMTNKLRETKITKKSSANNKPLAGAKLEILDEDKNSISCKIMKNGSLKTLEKCEWTSGTTKQSIYGLEDGKYYLKEVEAPEGYELSEEMIMFEVKNGVATVEMVNNLVVPVPDTLSPRSALLMFIAMFDIALGIGIITYVKKNRVTE